MESNNKPEQKVGEALNFILPYAKQFLDDPEAVKLMQRVKETLEFDIASFFDNDNKFLPTDQFPDGWEEFATYSEVDNGHGDSYKWIDMFARTEAVDELIEYARAFIQKLNN